MPAPPFPPPPSMAHAKDAPAPPDGAAVGWHPPGGAPDVASPAAPGPSSTAPVVASAEYGQWARNQRPPGSVYGGPGVPGGPGPRGSAASAMPEVAAPVGQENSGSLTGHILAHGRMDPARSTNSTARVILRLALVVAALIAVGLLVAALMSGSVRSVLEGLFGQ